MFCKSQMFERCTSGQCRHTAGEIAQCERLAALRDQMKRLRLATHAVTHSVGAATTVLRALVP